VTDAPWLSNAVIGLFGSVDTHLAQRLGRSVFRDRDLRSGNEASVANLMRKDGDDGEAARLG